MPDKPIAELTLTEARARLQELVDQLEKDTVELDQLPQTIGEAKQLLDHCEEKLRTIGDAAKEAGGSWWPENK